MNKSNILAIEGVPFAGKTTAIKYMIKHFPDQFEYIPEGSEYIGGHQNNPRLPFFTFEEAKINAHFVIAVEKRRYEDIKRIQDKSDKPIIVDRISPFFSLMFFKFIEEKKPFHYSFTGSLYQYALELFQAEFEKGNIFLPSKIVYLKPANEHTFKQRLPRGASTNIFTSWTNFVYFDELYMNMIKYHFQSNSIFLNSFNTQESLKLISKNIMNYLFFENIYRDDRYIFNTLLEKDKIFNINLDVEEEERNFHKIYEHYDNLIDKTGLMNKNG